jgi:hypothetical protein
MGMIIRVDEQDIGLGLRMGNGSQKKGEDEEWTIHGRISEEELPIASSFEQATSRNHVFIKKTRQARRQTAYLDLIENKKPSGRQLVGIKDKTGNIGIFLNPLEDETGRVFGYR